MINLIKKGYYDLILYSCCFIKVIVKVAIKAVTKVKLLLNLLLKLLLKLNYLVKLL